jgi:adenylate cyclase
MRLPSLRDMLLKHGRRLRLIAGLAVALLVAAACSLASHWELFEPYELKTQDVRFRKLAEPEKANPDIVLATVDDAGIAAFAKDNNDIGWPWWRAMYAYALEFLKRGGARLVVFDIGFLDQSQQGVDDDRQFADAIKSYGNAIFACPFATEPRAGDRDEKSIEKFAIHLNGAKITGIEKDKYRSVVMPISHVMNSAAGIGQAMIDPDPDGVNRSMPMLVSYNGQFYPSLALAAALRLAGTDTVTASKECISFGNTSVPLDNEGRMRMKFHGGWKCYRTFSLYKMARSGYILANETGEELLCNPQEFKNKIVFVGAEAKGLMDLRVAPTADQYLGVELHATALDNMLANDYLRRPSPAIRIGTIVILALVVGLTGAALTLRSHVPLCLFVGLAYNFACFKAFSSNLAMDMVAPTVTLVLAFAASSTLNYFIEIKKKRWIEGAFSQFLSPVVLEQLKKNPAALKPGGERREMTVLFSDLAGFTTMSEMLAPEALVSLLNEYLTAMADEIVVDHGGYVDKYIGDAIMAMWGAPLDDPKHASKACLAALANVEKLAQLNKSFAERQLPELGMRIGINSGPMVVGMMGSARKLNYTVIGDTVNLASRMEGANKQFGSKIMISESTYRLAKDDVDVRELDKIAVKGKNEPVVVYELLARKGALDAKKSELIKLFNEGMKAYNARDWAKAEEAFRKATALVPDDGPSAVYVERCRKYKEAPPPADWDGVFRLKTK